MQYLSKSLTITIIAIFLFLIGDIQAQQEETFKINKLNLIWTKAQHSLGATKLKDLKNDLIKHESDELSLKKMKAHNQDKDGLFEASVRKRLLTIMSKYSLERYYDDIHPPIEAEHDMKKSNLNKSKIESGDHISQLKPTFRDKKLDKLWKKAEQTGFSQEQLMILHDEFQHQQDKLDEHYEAMNQLEQKLTEKFKERDRWENTVDGSLKKEAKRQKNSVASKESHEMKKARLESNIHQDLKEKYKDIKKDIDKLHKKIVSGKVDDSGPFEEEPVNALWSAAIQVNFTSDELESFREELEHYEVRIKKLKHFQNELERDKIGSKESKSYGEETKDSKHVKKRVKELTNKVEKTHKSLEERITQRRDEL